MIAILTNMDSNKIEVTYAKVTLTLIPKKRYYAIWMGPKLVQPETLLQQIKRAIWK